MYNFQYQWKYKILLIYRVFDLWKNINWRIGTVTWNGCCKKKTKIKLREDSNVTKKSTRKSDIINVLEQTY